MIQYSLVNYCTVLYVSYFAMGGNDFLHGEFLYIESVRMVKIVFALNIDSRGQMIEPTRHNTLLCLIGN